MTIVLIIIAALIATFVIYLIKQAVRKSRERDKEVEQ
jgi:hypothetical protein